MSTRKNRAYKPKDLYARFKTRKATTPIKFKSIKPMFEAQNQLQTFILKNTQPLFFSGDQYQYIEGGVKHGARYPDFLFGSQDVLRAKELLGNKPRSSDQIVRIVDKTFKLSSGGFPHDLYSANKQPYNKKYVPFDFKFHKANDCFKSFIKNPKPHGLTNLSALPFGIADCREAAWYTALLCFASDRLRDPESKAVYSVCYCKVYLEDETHVYFYFDHLFVARIEDGKTELIDAMTYLKLPNNLRIHGMPLKLTTLIGKEGFYCGTGYDGGKPKYKIFAVPKIYNGKVKLLEISKFLNNPSDDVLFWGSPMRYENGPHWGKFSEWCPKKIVNQSINMVKHHYFSCGFTRSNRRRHGTRKMRGGGAGEHTGTNTDYYKYGFVSRPNNKKKYHGGSVNNAKGFNEMQRLRAEVAK